MASEFFESVFMRDWFFRKICVYLMFFVLSGCARYRSGYPISQTFIKTIYVAPAVQRAIVPQMSATLSRQIREEIIRNSNLRLVDKGCADVELETTITNYGRSIGTVDEYDPDTAKTLSLNASVCCNLKCSDGHYIFKNQTFSSSISINANNSAQALEYQRLPQLARELAKKITTRIMNLDASINR